MIVSGTMYYEITQLLLLTTFQWKKIIVGYPLRLSIRKLNSVYQFNVFAFIYPAWSTTVPQSSHADLATADFLKSVTYVRITPWILSDDQTTKVINCTKTFRFITMRSLIRKRFYFCLKKRFHHRWIWIKIMLRPGSFLTWLKNFWLDRLILILSILLGRSLFRDSVLNSG